MSESARGRTADTYETALSEIAPNASRLKRGYNSRLGRALLAAVNLHLLLVGVYWIATYATAETALENEGDIVIEGIYVDPKIRDLPDAPPARGPETAPPVAPGTPTPVPDAVAEPDATVRTQEELAAPGIGPVGPPSTGANGDGTGPPERLVAPILDGPGDPPTPPVREDEPVAETPDAPEVFDYVEQEPELIGGIGALQAGIEYPEFERRVGVAGRVIVRFVVDEAGIPSDVEVVRRVSPGLDAAAVRAVERARFTPGVQNGRTVRVRVTLPVVFRLQ